MCDFADAQGIVDEKSGNGNNGLFNRPLLTRLQLSL
jgi:hypothetical protein